ncbi:MAG TPA: hypothetical protein VGF55_32070 [Gemmataceae bacterium]
MQKPLARLVCVGVLMLAAVGVAVLWPVLWAPSVILAQVGTYLVLWAAMGHGRWCRGCKRFDGV